MPNPPAKCGEKRLMPGWYYLIDGSVRGPVSLGMMLEINQAGELTPDTLVWAKSIERWMPIKRVDSFEGFLPDTPLAGTISKYQENNYGKDAGCLGADGIESGSLHCGAESSYTYSPRPWVAVLGQVF